MEEILGCESGQKIDRVFRPGTDELCSEQDSVEIINEFFAAVCEMVVQDLADIPHKQLDEANQTLLKESFNPMSVGKLLDIIKELHYLLNI